MNSSVALESYLLIFIQYNYYFIFGGILDVQLVVSLDAENFTLGKI